MEGPTPVSALIHAATMVTAGVFLLIRCSFIFEFLPEILYIISIIGAFTAFFSATIALVQMDIKKLMGLVTSPAWQTFEEYLEEDKDMTIKRVMNSSDDKEIAKAQGRFALAEQVLNIRTLLINKNE